ncbi:FtsX-like permease family protein [Actinopolymorpha alba]|uniref:FtsX-like permease family protein n=1 Tax=Actinopolymorpha alba TaxID=533267 RepID=UPI00036D678A|nr:ABC transporter permease [Actinopolymorpha alba]
MMLASIRGHAARYVAGGLAVVLGVAFVTTALLVLNSTKAAMAEAVGAQYARADLVVASNQNDLTPDAVRRIQGMEGVAAASGVAVTGVEVHYPGSPGSVWVQVSGIPLDPDLRWQRVKDGRLPEKPDEVAVAASTAKDKNLRLGTRLTLTTGQSRVHDVRVVGIVRGGTLAQDITLVATDQATTAWGDGATYLEVLVRAADGADLAALRTRLSAAVGADITVQTANERVTELVAGLTGGVDVLGAFLLGFAGIALFVATLVVANTFTILLAQRTRELALLRCVGARRGQVFGSVLLESVVLGVAASALGVAAGAGLAALAVRLLEGQANGLMPSSLMPSTPTLVVPFVAGLTATVAAALAPARRATRVSPLAALRPEMAVTVRSRAGVVRVVLALVLVLGGGAILVAGTRTSAIMVGLAAGIGGGLVSFLGVLLGAPVLVPAAVRLIGLLSARVGGVPGRLAVSNAVRNPRRTAATAAALLVGVTLISLMTVGAASVQRTLHESLDRSYPLDLTVSAEGGERLADRTLAALRGVDGLAGTVPLRAGQVALVDDPSMRVQVHGVDPAAAAKLLRNPGPLGGLRDGLAIVGPVTAAQFGLEEGGSWRLRTSSGGELTVRVRMVRDEDTPSVIVSAGDLARLAPKAQIAVLWARIGEPADTKAVLERVQQVVGDLDNVSVGGAAPMRAMYDQILDVLLLIATGLLAVAVVIALVGVGNTLSLSVIERTREQALLRALGLTRGQLRGMLAFEALLIAAAAVVLGLLLGIGYGWSGTTVLLRTAAEGQVALDIPVSRLLLVAGVALVAGLAASVLPARRAVRVPPAAALGDE